MEDIKSVIAKNIAELRINKGMTQIDLAEKLNYSDKSVSKWERGESLPDITVLVEMAKLFGVTLDYLVEKEHDIPVSELKEDEKTKQRREVRNHGFITGMSILLVWLVAALAFVICDIVALNRNAHYLAFAYALPVSAIVWLVFNSIWFNRRRNFLIISIMMWTFLACLCLSFTILAQANIWIIMILGIFGQAIIVLWSKMKPAGK